MAKTPLRKHSPNIASKKHGYRPKDPERTGLDLYLWLTYRTFNLTRPMRLTWTQLYRQFGVNPARATDQGTVNNFRRDCLRELQKIKRSWPDLHYRTVKGALLLSPSPAVIAPSQLRLVDAGRP